MWCKRLLTALFSSFPEFKTSGMKGLKKLNPTVATILEYFGVSITYLPKKMSPMCCNKKWYFRSIFHQQNGFHYNTTLKYKSKPFKTIKTILNY